jgi:type IV pilus assembly protein PilV
VRFPASIRGVSLLEVMISVLIMGIGLLGIAAMQATALRNSQSSAERSQAIIQSYSIIDAMRANRQNAMDGQYNTSGWMCEAPAAGSLSASDRTMWLSSLRSVIGSGATDQTVCGQVQCTTSTGICVVGVRWDDSRAGASNGTQAGSDAYVVETRVRL